MAARTDPRSDAEKIFLEAVKSAGPYLSVKEHFKRSPVDTTQYKNIYVIGAGKAACQMAKAVEEAFGSSIASGLVVTKYGHSLPLKRIKVAEASHPIPDRSGLKAASEILKIASIATEGDLVITLLSGGASALLPAPDGITLRDKKRTTELLVNSGATIQEINTVRKHLSRIKGGRLMKEIFPARSLTIIISDVVGDDVSTIASGPTAPDPTTYREALGVIKKYGLVSMTPRAVLKKLKGGIRGSSLETPKPGDSAFKRCENIIIANNLKALEAAKKLAISMGYSTLILSGEITGPTRFTAAFFSAILREVKRSGNPVTAPACVLFGGETTLKVEGQGLGGRNQEFALSTAILIEGLSGVTVLSAGTDGTDGPTDAAGAFADSTTIERAKSKGLDPVKYLKDNDSYNFFKPLKDLFITGPTGTNVMDLVIAVIE